MDTPTPFRSVVLSFVLLLLVASAPARADVVISDDDFLASEWSISVYSVAGGATHSETRPLTGGNPNQYRQMTHTLPAGSSIGVAHVYLPGIYHPWLEGPIYSLYYREDQVELSPPSPGATVGARPIVAQGGIIFFGPDITFSNTFWDTRALTGLTAEDFTSASLTHPDFSVCGEPLQFGIARSNNNAGASAISTVNGVDNFSITVYTAPTGVGSGGAAPAAIRIASANPFSDGVTIELTPGHFGRAVVGIYDVTGRLVRSLENRELWGEVTERRWDGTDDTGARVASGVYFVRLQIGSEFAQKKLLIMR